MAGETTDRKTVTFQLIKTTALDRKGRFYIPNSIVDTAFEGIPEGEREVSVYLGPGGQILLVPERRE